MELFSTRNSPISSFVRWAKRFFGGSIFFFWMKTVKIGKQTFSTSSHQFSRRTCSFSSVTTRQQCSPDCQQFSRYWPGGKNLIWNHPRDLDLASDPLDLGLTNESAYSCRKRISYITMRSSMLLEVKPRGTLRVKRKLNSTHPWLLYLAT